MDGVKHHRALKINAPEWFEREDFMAWLNTTERRPATWHRKGDGPDEYSDIFTWYEDEYNGSDTDMPKEVWDELVRICKEERFWCGIIWITNLYAKATAFDSNKHKQKVK